MTFFGSINIGDKIVSEMEKSKKNDLKNRPGEISFSIVFQSGKLSRR